jgi:transposase
VACNEATLVPTCCGWRRTRADLSVSQAMVGNWRRRFVESRLDGLHDEPRPGGPRKIGDEEVEAVVVRTLESQPESFCV